MLFLIGWGFAPARAASNSPLRVEVLPNALRVQFESPPLEFSQREWAGSSYDMVSFAGAEWLYEDGKPLVPYYSALIGIPPEGVPDVSVLGKDTETLQGYRLLPVTPTLYLSLPGRPPKAESPPPTFSFAGEHPTVLVRIKPIGYVRQQRLAQLAIFPVQYNPVTGEIRWHRALEFRVEFPDVPLAPASPSSVRDSEAFEELFQSSLLNYRQAMGWRKPRPRRKYVATPPMGREVFKLYVRESGVYRVTQEQLAFRSQSLVQEDPRHFRLFNGGQEVPIYVEGEADGRFDPGDAIIFYGQKLLNQKFTDENVYLLTVGDGPGLRIPDRNVLPSEEEIPPLMAYRAIEHFEEDNEYDPLLNVRDELQDHYFWFGMNGSTATGRRRDMEFQFPYAAQAPEEQGVLRIQLQGISYDLNQKHIVDVIFNGILITTATWNGQRSQQIEARVDQWLFNPRQSNFITLIYQNNHQTPPSEKDIALDWIEFEYWHTFEAQDGRLEFSNEVLPRDVPQRRYRVRGFTSDQIQAFQVQGGQLVARLTDARVEPEDGGYALVFDEPADLGATHYVVFERFQSGLRIVKDTPSNLKAPSHRADYVIITHETFLDAVQPLAEFRRSQGHQVLVVNVEDIYDEFNSGLFDPRAIQGFLRYAYHNWAVPPSYVLLVGDAHYDYKGAIVRIYRRYYNKDYNLYPIYVPTYHGWAPESGETAMDHRFVMVSGDDPLPDMAIGRLPVQNVQELRDVIGKIITYETATPPGEWQQRIVQVADNDVDHPGDEEFERSRRRIMRDYIPIGYERVPIYLGQLNSPWQTNRLIQDAFNDGAVVLEYAGHGGRETWADEGIFRIEDVPRLRNQFKPWVITTTCLNGMFDFPQEEGQRTLSEELLLSRNRGAIAALSATRLTFAQANSAFDEYLFTEIFQQRPPQLGLIVMNAKIKFLAGALLMWVPGAEQYTLFGDPATPLALPPVKIPTQLEQVAVDPGQKLVIKRSELITYRRTADGTWNPEKADQFNGQLTVRVLYPNNLDDDPKNDLPIQTRRLPIVDGRISDIHLDVNAQSLPGIGEIRLFAMNDQESAIGGARFSVYEPVIVEGPVEELTETELFISVKIMDNQGASGIRSVICRWRHPITHTKESTPMVLDADNWYHLAVPIPLPAAGRTVRYSLEITDTEGNTITTPEKSVAVPVGADLTIWRSPTSGSPLIEYVVSEDRWELATRVGNQGKRHVLKAFDVLFFDGHPDKNGDLIVDDDAVLLAQTRVEPDAWQEQSGGDYLQTVDVRARLDQPLSSGLHQIFVWADPQRGPRTGTSYGELEEPYYFNNRLYKLIPVNDFILQQQDVLAYSLDRAFEALIPADATSPTTISITASELNGLKQPDLTPIPRPTTDEARQFKLQLHSGVETFRTPVQLNMRFDFIPLQAEVMQRLGLRLGRSLTAEEQQRLDQALLEEAQRMGIYRYVAEYDQWLRLESTPLLDEEGKLAVKRYITPAIATNQNPQFLQAKAIRVDPTRTFLGEWAVVFFDAEHYHVYVRRKGIQTFERFEQVGKISTLWQDPVAAVGLAIYLEHPAEQKVIPFGFGDTFTFRTVEDSSGAIVVADIRNADRGDGTAFIELIPLPDWGRFVSGDWLIFFIDSENYELRDSQDQPVLRSHGAPIRGRVGSTLRLEDLGFAITVQSGTQPFAFGDTIRFATTEVGMIQTSVKRTGTYALMQNRDTLPPTVQLWVDGTELTNGLEVAPRPEISILVEDANGVIPESLRLEQSKGDAPFSEITLEKHFEDVNTFSMVYTPILFRGNYRLRITAQDFNGNGIQQGETPYYEVRFTVTKDPDLDAPTILVLANGEQLQEGDVLTQQPKFQVILRDNERLAPSTVRLAFGPPHDLVVLDPQEYEQQVLSAQEMLLSYAPDLVNGEYALQVEVADEVGNAADPYQVTFTLDEAPQISDVLNVPNPFRDSTVFTFDLTQVPESLEVRIYSVSGRLLRTLYPGDLRRGYNEVYWDGRDERGDPIASGVVFYRVIMRDQDRRVERYGKAAILR